MSQEIVKATSLSFPEINSIAKAFYESGMFQDIKGAAQAVVKIQAGQEFGIAPFAAMTGIHIIQGRPTVGAGLIASKIKSSGRYDYKIIEMTEKVCTIEFFEHSKSVGTSSFTIEDARKAGTKNMDKHPKNMLFARAISNGVKWFAADVFNSPIYTPEEFDDMKPEAPAAPATQANVVSSTIKAEPAKSEAATEKTTPAAAATVIQPTQEEKPFVIPGHWYAKVEKCKTVQDVIDLYNKYKETIDASPELKALLSKTRDELKSKAA